MDHRVEKFMAVVESESFTDAAERLHVSQPSLSIAIKNLEKELGVQLIVRGGNFFQVTEEGKLVYEYGSQARLQLNNLKAELSKESKSAATLRVGMIDSIADVLFSSGSVNTDANLEVQIDNSSRLLRSLRLDRADMAIVTRPFGGIPPEYVSIGEYEEKFSLVCSPLNRKEVHRKLKEECLVNDFLTYDRSSTTFQWINRAMTRQGLSYVPKFFSTNPELMLQMALSGQGTALLPMEMAKESINNKKLTSINSFEFTRLVVVVVLKGKFISEDMREICEKVVTL